MSTAYVIITVITVLANVGNVVMDFANPKSVQANAAEVRVPANWIPWLAALKGAGAAGLLVGLLGAPAVGLAAATGLVLFFVGAVAAHVRFGVFHNIAFAGSYLALAVATLALTVAR
ncbi:DoxX family protein [Streptomyces sp. NPDC048057]|uniref:DoxX family protein n=1 Tax=Streptomyces sp. NPDC048057 TaxID=3155628 RepID=UPI00340812B3